MLFIKKNLCRAGISICLVVIQASSLAQNISFEVLNSQIMGLANERNVQLVRKEFNIVKRGVNPVDLKYSKLYITAMGLYEASLNGKRVGSDFFSPGFSNYNKRLQYQVYDVSKLIKKGKNVLEILVAKGWYSGIFRNLESDTVGGNFGEEIGVLCEIRNGKGSVILMSDQSWLQTNSKIKSSSFYGGEVQDRNLVVKNWIPVKILNYNKEKLIPNDAEKIIKHEQFKPVAVFVNSKQEHLIDFGQNIAGWVRFTVKGKKGDTVRLFHAELLDSFGNFYTGNLRNAKSVDTYILNGKKEILEPHFTYHGFRYVKVEGMNVKDRAFKAVAVYSDLKPTGKFSCSDPMLNQLQNNIEWSMKSNFIDIPTDCPQRSERLGWTGDAQVFAPTASYLMNTKKFYSKWLSDVASEQGVNGGIPNFVPTSSPYRPEVYGVAGWGDVATILPWRLYQSYGDTALLRSQYPMMKGWVDYMTSVSKNGLFVNKGYGDWYAPGDSTSVSFIGQCFYAHSVDLLSRSAEVLGLEKESKDYEELFRCVVKNFEHAYGKMDTRSTSTQTAYALALAFDILPVEQRRSIADKLAIKVKSNGYKLATGFLGTPHLLEALSKFGHTDIAYRLLLQRECPSWLYPITKGATTMWERWDAIRPDGSVQNTSFNHYAYGAVGQWMYENIIGLRSVEPGYRRIEIKPLIGGGLTWAEGSYETQFGKIEIGWKAIPKTTGNSVVKLRVKIPKGVTAEVLVPGETKPKEVAFGVHHFIGKL